MASFFWTETNRIAISWNRDEFLRKNQTEGRWHRGKKSCIKIYAKSQFFLIIGFAVEIEMREWDTIDLVRHQIRNNIELLCWRDTITLIKLVNKLLAPDKLIYRHNSLRFQILSNVQATKDSCTALTQTHSLGWWNPLALVVPFEWRK